MKNFNKTFCYALLTASVALSGCGGGAGDNDDSNAKKNNHNPAPVTPTPTPPPTPTPVADVNTFPITVERWTGNYANMPYVTVTLCIPGVQGSTQCATIDHMQLDTGSAGVRVLASALGPALASRLPAQSGATNDPTGNAPITECAVFGSGYTWGQSNELT